MNTLYLNQTWRNVVNFIVYGDYQARLMNGEASWTVINKEEHLNKSRNAVLARLAEAQIPHQFVDDGQDRKVLVIG